MHNESDFPDRNSTCKSIEPISPSQSTDHLRLALVTRRFWPYSGSTEFAVGDLATEIKHLGHNVDILTVRWEKNWPTYFQFQELSVRRVNRPTTGPWGSFRYLRALTRDLIELAPNGIIVFGLGDEAWTVSKTFGGRIPFVIRVDNHQLGSQDQLPNFTTRQVAAINLAKSVLVESQWTADRIAGHPLVTSDSIQVVPDGIQVEPEQKRTATKHGSSRVALSDAHPILMIEPTQPLVICGSPLDGDEGLIDLVNAWSRVLERFPRARLWILGDGSKGRLVWDKLLEQNMVHSVIMPGSFDDLNEIFQAADVYVHPLRSDECCGILNRALVKGVCSVVTSTGATRSVVENNATGLVVGINDSRALADALILAISNRDLRERLGRAALKSLATAYDIKTLVSQYVDPFMNASSSVLETKSGAEKPSVNSNSPSS